MLCTFVEALYSKVAVKKLHVTRCLSGRMNIYRIVVAPHYRKLCLFAVLCTKEALVDAVKSVAAVCKPVPVKNKAVNTVVNCGVDFLCHNLRI